MTRSSSIRLWIDVGATLFLIALIVSAMLVPELRPLHLLQALIYVAVIILAHRNSAWGFGAGFSIGIVWNSFSLFVTHLMQAGAVAFWTSVHAGHVEQLVPMMVTLGGIGHFVLILATLTACLRQNAESKKWLSLSAEVLWRSATSSLLSLWPDLTDDVSFCKLLRQIACKLTLNYPSKAESVRVV